PQSMKPVTIMMVALALAACTPEQDIGQCELEAIRLYPNNPPRWTEDEGSRYVVTCMKAKGYEFLLTADARLRSQGDMNEMVRGSPRGTGCLMSPSRHNPHATGQQAGVDGSPRRNETRTATESATNTPAQP